MAQYPLPQFIEEENKITFFLTFRQFFLLVGGIITCFIFYYTLPFYFFVGLSLFLMIVIATIAFLKIDDESIIKVILHYINFYTDDKNFTWKKGDIVYETKTPVIQSEIKDQNKESNENKEGYNYMKYNSNSPNLGGIATTKISKLNAAKKAVEFKGK